MVVVRYKPDTATDRDSQLDADVDSTCCFLFTTIICCIEISRDAYSAKQYLAETSCIPYYIIS
jgi:hypothetical protein